MWFRNPLENIRPILPSNRRHKLSVDHKIHPQVLRNLQENRRIQFSKIPSMNNSLERKLSSAKGSYRQKTRNQGYGTVRASKSRFRSIPVFQKRTNSVGEQNEAVLKVRKHH